MFARLTVSNVCIITTYNVGSYAFGPEWRNGHAVDCDSHGCRFDSKKCAKNVWFMQPPISRAVVRLRHPVSN